MTRIARGEERALTELLERHGPVVFGLARRITGDQQIAEEVLQDSFLRVAREAANYRPSPSGVAPWLLRIARNASIDAIRRRKREKRVGSGGDPGVLDGVADARASESSEGVALDEFGSAVRVALGELPQGPRKALDLAYFNGLTHSEIAEKLQVPLGTAKTWVRTGLQTLRERLARFIEPGRSS
jgi:RNA polymerase sigma-70 factor (ECF subfamily)